MDTSRVEPEHPHWTLIFMTVFTQMAVGAIASMSASQSIAGSAIARVPAAGCGADCALRAGSFNPASGQAYLRVSRAQHVAPFLA